jgi:phosphatidyl-myo-inositol dimannoside synthase
LLVRILFVSHSFPPPGRLLDNLGGMQRLATELHAALRAHPRVQLSDLLLRSSWRWTHVRMVPFGAHLLREIPRRVAAERIEAILFSSMVTAAAALPLRRALRGVVKAAVPVGRDVTLPVQVYQRLVPHVFRSLDALFPISDATARECLTRGARPGQIEVIPCGVDIGRFAPPIVRAEARRRLLEQFGVGDADPPPRLLLCGVGRHVERKGFSWFVNDVMPRLPQHVHFWLAGEGPCTPLIRRAVATRGLGQRVRLLGVVSEGELAALLRGADLFVMPNVPVPGDMEGFGVVMLEAGIAGLPVIAARLEGIEDVIREGENGNLVESGDARAFARRILYYDEEPGALEEASGRAAHFTAAEFGWSTVAERYVDALSARVRGRQALASGHRT